MRGRSSVCLGLVLVIWGWSSAAEGAPDDPRPGAKQAARARRKKPKPTPPAVAVPSPPPAEEAPVVFAPGPAPSPPPAPELTASTSSAAPPEQWEEVVDFEAEESAQAAAAAPPAHGPPSGLSGMLGSIGVKLIVDVLVDYRVGEEKFEFRPNHTYVLLAVKVLDDVQFIFHISDNPIFYELEWNITPRLSLKVGKLLVPFGTNEFHHIIGGRVDQESQFLPETWGDFGLGIQHLLVDEEYFTLEYTLYAVNGFEGQDAPNVSAGDVTDNNWFKDIGGRVKFGFLSKYQLVASAYYGKWDADNAYSHLFYALGFECRPGFIPVPGLDRLRLRAEWARGEIQLPGDNPQQGLTQHQVARGGFYAELQARIVDMLAVRVRTGRINPDNTVVDDGDVVVIEPALLIGTGKITVTAAYQFTLRSDLSYSPTEPRDIAYAKVFLQF